jgi:hypothetical protein
MIPGIGVSRVTPLLAVAVYFGSVFTLASLCSFTVSHRCALIGATVLPVRQRIRRNPRPPWLLPMHRRLTSIGAYWTVRILGSG